MPDLIDVRIVQLEHAAGLPLPGYETEGAAGADVRAAHREAFILEAGAITRIPTGLVLEVPEGYEVQLRPRSGLAARHGLTLPNSPATIDSDYRGEVMVLLQNLGTAAVTIERGERIAQMVLQRVPRIQWRQVSEVTSSDRGAGGFGSTGRD